MEIRIEVVALEHVAVIVLVLGVAVRRVALELFDQLDGRLEAVFSVVADGGNDDVLLVGKQIPDVPLPPPADAHHADTDRLDRFLLRCRQSLGSSPRDRGSHRGRGPFLQKLPSMNRVLHRELLHFLPRIMR
jgi:hypothetical protein